MAPPLDTIQSFKLFPFLASFLLEAETIIQLTINCGWKILLSFFHFFMTKIVLTKFGLDDWMCPFFFFFGEDDSILDVGNKEFRLLLEKF